MNQSVYFSTPSYTKMASGSTMTGVNVPDSRDNSLTPPLPKKVKPRNAKLVKELEPKVPPLYPRPRISERPFHDAPIEIIPIVGYGTR